MKLKKIYSCLALLLILLSACSGGGGGGGGNSSDSVYEGTLGDTTLLLVKKSDHFLMYRKQSHFNCYVFIRFDIESQSGNSYFIDGGGGQLVEIAYEPGTYSLQLGAPSLNLVSNGQVESDIKPKCGDPQSQGEVSVAITFQQLPDTIRRTGLDFYEWKVTFDMDNDMQTSTGDIVFTVNTFTGNQASAEQTTIEEIGAELFVYFDNSGSSSIGDLSLVIDGNTMVITAPKSLYTTLENITTQTQINVDASYSDGLAYHSDYLPGSGLFTAVMDTSDISDELNDQSGTASLVDIVNVAVTTD